MKRKSIVIAILFCFIALSTAVAGLETDIENSPMIFQASGKGDLTLSATRYPQFEYQNGWSDNDACGNGLVNNYSNRLLPGKTSAFSKIDDMYVLVTIPVGLRSNAQLLINWTLRVEATGGNAINPWTAGLCSPWHGSINETFKGGKFSSQAYVKYGGKKGNISEYSAVGAVAVMTIPTGSTVTVYNPNDPTHTGSCLISAPVGGFPEVVHIQIMWQNDTSLPVLSRTDYRNLVVTLMPKGK